MACGMRCKTCLITGTCQNNDRKGFSTENKIPCSKHKSRTWAVNAYKMLASCTRLRLQPSRVATPSGSEIVLKTGGPPRMGMERAAEAVPQGGAK